MARPCPQNRQWQNSKTLLYGELEGGERGKDCPVLRYKDVCKRDMKALGVVVFLWESVASDIMHGNML